LENSEKEIIDAKSQALVYAQQVFAGAKLAASLTVKSSLGNIVAIVAEQEGCQTIIENNDNWRTIIIYKYPFVSLLIKEIQARWHSSEPPSLYDVWSTGKLFGYSDYEIAIYLQDQGYIESALRSKSQSESNKRPCRDS